MTLLEKTIAQIAPPDTKATDAIRRQLETAMHNAAGLGDLEKLLTDYAAILGSTALEKPKKCTIVCCADHGVATMKVSAYPPETTVQMTWTSFMKPSGKSGRIGRSIRREVRVSFSEGRASRLKKPPGILPAA